MGAVVGSAAGALFVDERGRVMLVEPTYKPMWEIPGGVIESGETPSAACAREIDEELVFYMQSRGIARRDAVRILVEGYFEEVIQRLHDPVLEEMVRERIAQKIAEAEEDVREYVAQR